MPTHAHPDLLAVDWSTIPAPIDDGAARHLAGSTLPDVALPATDGRVVSLAQLTGPVVVFAYPRTGRPGEAALVDDWDAIPGARGCTPQSCAFRDLHAALIAAGASHVFGLSTQDTDYQREAVARLQLPFALLSDHALALTRAARLPTLEVAGQTLIARLAMIVDGGVVEQVFYPVFPPDQNAATVLAWLTARSSSCNNLEAAASLESPAVDAITARIAAAGRSAWPEVVIADSLIRDRLAARMRDDPGVPFDDRHDADLYLAIALAINEPAALRAFETTLVPEVDAALQRLRLPGGTADEVKQALRFELFVGDDGVPKIADYAGRGELAGWLRVSATRKALKLARRSARDQSIDELLLEQWPDATPGPAMKHLRATYTAELKRAIGDAFGALEVRQRNLLRQHVLDELTIDDLARLYRVHRATCARWLADARAELGRDTRKRLIAALGLPPDELDSLLRFLDSDIELSFSRIMHTR